MILLVDLGNTRIKWAAVEGGNFTPGGTCVHRGEDLAGLLSECWREVAAAPRRLYVASVAGSEQDQVLVDWVAGRWGTPVEFVRTAVEGGGVRNGYHEPWRLGVDRWVALIAARQMTPGAACIGDFGTAVTIDGLAPDGRHLGGCIFPGRSAMASLLDTATAGVSVTPEAEETLADEGVFARDTLGGVSAAAHHGAAALMDKALAQMESKYSNVTCLITGGDAPVMRALLPERCVWMPDLVLRGLYYLAQEMER